MTKMAIMMTMMMIMILMMFIIMLMITNRSSVDDFQPIWNRKVVYKLNYCFNSYINGIRIHMAALLVTI